MTRRPIVVDPGHGGVRRLGKSTPFGHRGPFDLVEKELTLDIGQRVQRRLQGRASVLLTRDDDRNLTLRARTDVAHRHAARSFLSLHFDGGAGAPSVWIHERASGASRALALNIARSLGPLAAGAAPRIARARIAVLDPHHHHRETAGCLVELGRLQDPEEASRLIRHSHREALAEAIADSLVPPEGGERAGPAGSELDIYYEVPLVYQLTGMSCWAAAAAMVVGWRDCRAIRPEEVASGVGEWEAYRDGLEPEDVDQLARAWGLALERPRDYSLATLRRLLETYGPLWTGEASPGLHVIVLAGMFGDGTPEGTFVRIADPWPVGEGERYTIAFSSLARAMEAAGDLTGITAQVLHAGRDAHRRTRVWTDPVTP